MLRYKKNRWIARTDGAILVELTRGKVAIVDPEDWDEIKKYKWCVGGRSGELAAVSNTGGRRVYMHRVIMGATKGQIVDHIDHDTLDNRRVNLRLCTPSQSIRNRRKFGRNGGATTSIYKGVSWEKYKRKWIAQCRWRRKDHYLGSFDNEADAARAYNAAAREHHKEFACLNEIIE